MGSKLDPILSQLGWGQLEAYLAAILDKFRANFEFMFSPPGDAQKSIP